MKIKIITNDINHENDYTNFSDIIKMIDMSQVNDKIEISINDFKNLLNEYRNLVIDECIQKLIKQ